MRIIISDDVCEDKGFPEWLVRQIRQELILASNENQFEAISGHIEEKLGIKVDIFDVLLKILSSIRTLRGNRLTQIVIENKVLYKDSRLSTQSLAKLIDVGNMEIRGTHIFSIVFDRVRKNLDKYLTKYIFENGGI